MNIRPHTFNQICGLTYIQLKGFRMQMAYKSSYAGVTLFPPPSDIEVTSVRALAVLVSSSPPKGLRPQHIRVIRQFRNCEKMHKYINSEQEDMKNDVYPVASRPLTRWTISETVN